MRSYYEYCPGCSDVVAVGEPCECVFVTRGTIDAQGVLHTAARVPADIDTIIAAMPDELAAVMPTQVDHWTDLDMPRDEIIENLVAIWQEAPALAHQCLGVEPAEFPLGEFNTGAHWRQPASAPEPVRQACLTERGGDPEDWLIIDEPTGEDSERAHLALSSPYAHTYWYRS